MKDKESREKIKGLAVETLHQMTGNIASNWCRVLFRRMAKTGDMREALRKTWTLTEKSRLEKLYDPPVMVIVVADQDKRETHVYHSGSYAYMHTLSAAAAIQNMMLAGYALGVGSTWLTFWDPIRIQDMFGIPSGMDVVGILTLVYPSEWPSGPTGGFTGAKGIYPRRPLKDMVHYEKYDESKLEKFRETDPYLSWLSDEEREKRVKKLGGVWP